jgi:hypothetical protein
MKKLLMLTLVVTALTQAAPTDSFTPMLGKWIGVGCGPRYDLALRIEMSGTETMPMLRIREFATDESTQRMSRTENGKHQFTQGMHLYSWTVKNQDGDALWMLRTNPDDKKMLVGLIQVTSKSIFKLKFNPDDGQDLSAYLKEKETICRRLN